MLQKIRKKLEKNTIKPLIYSEGLRDAYLGISVTGGTLQGKSVLITGATGGIGVALALRFSYEGCNVILAGRSNIKLKDTLTYINKKKADATIEVQSLNLMDFNSIDESIKRLKSRDNFIDILINNAGVYTDVDKKRIFRSVSKEQFENVWKTNYTGTIYLTKLVAEEFNRRDINGTIIQISSICTRFRNYQYTPYGMSKTAMMQYSRDLKAKNRKLNIQIIEPGSVATGMGNLKIGDNIGRGNNILRHPALPEEIAALAAFLSSPTGRYINNQSVVASACEVL